MPHAGKGLEIAKLSAERERANAVLHIVDQKGNACITPMETMICDW